jgi:hypothetical protein
MQYMCTGFDVNSILAARTVISSKAVSYEVSVSCAASAFDRTIVHSRRKGVLQEILSSSARLL